MLSYLLNGGDWRSFLIELLISLPIIFLSLSVHETAHGLVAYKLGDPTARSLGRLTLNPLKHIDPIGFICMLLCGFGWANPVPINTRNFKKPRRDMAISALAGPLSNVALAFIFAFLSAGLGLAFSLMNKTLPIYVDFFLMCGVSMNATLAVFNLFPIPPLDGSKILYAFLPQRLTMWMIKNERVISIVLMVVLILSPVVDILSSLVSLPIFLAAEGIFVLIRYLISLF